MRTVLVCLLVGLVVNASNYDPQPFGSKKSFVYRFNSQVASSLIGSLPNEIQQAAATRLRSDVLLSFTSDSEARVQLRNIRIGELNGELPKSQRVQPLEHFERRELSQEVQQTLEMPMFVKLTDGVVEKMNFHEDDSVWSKNIKRAVLNMMQLNLKRNDVQGAEMHQKNPEGEEDNNSPVFTIPEITLEGECDTVYTIQKSHRYDEENDQGLFNVTKTINFNRCNRTADVSFGYQANPSQEVRCFNCIHKHRSQPDEEAIEELRYSHCQLECQPNRINKENDVERSTFGRFELMGKTEKYAIKRVTMLSQYLVKAQNPASQNALIQTVALAELTFKETTDDDKMVPEFKQSETEEKLLYSPQWDVKEKRFYMAGDEEFEKNSPFQKIQKKKEKITHSLRAILKQWSDQELGYEMDSAINFNRLVTVVRQSSVKDLRAIEDLVRAGAQSGNNRDDCWCKSCNEQCEEHAKSLFLDSLAVAGTRNSLYVLAEKIVKQDVSTSKAVQTLQTFVANQHSPSSQQIDILERIMKHEVAHRSRALKQTAVLSYGSAVGAICQIQPTQGQHELFRVEELCSRSKREHYKTTLMQQFQQAQTTYEQILSLKAIGNAALENILDELKRVVVQQKHSTLVRMEAIDAMRRLRTSKAHKIRQALLPVFQNQREQSELRMAAFSMIMYTHPEKAVLDQMTFTVISDRSQNLKSFVMSTMEALSQSPNSAEQEVANHMKSALKMIKITPDEQRPSRRYQVPIYVSEQENMEEQNFFLGLASIVSPANMIPIHLSASLRSAFGGEAAAENVQLSFTQKNLEQWYEKIADFAHSYGQSNRNNKEVRQQASNDLKNIYSSLAIKSRRHGSYYLSSEDEMDYATNDEQEQKAVKFMRNEPFGMIVIRTNDIDHVIVPITKEQLPQVVQKMLKGEKPSLSDFQEMTQKLTGSPFQKHGAISVGEKKTKIPTIAGFPLSMIRQTTAVGSVQGQIKLNTESMGLNAEWKIRTSGIATHMHKAELWTPVIELYTPLEGKLQLDNSRMEATIRPSQKHKVRVLGIHTLPVTFTTHFDMELRTHREPRVRTIHNWVLEQNQQEHQMNKERVLMLDGHFLALYNPKQLLHAFYTTENNLHVYYNPTAQTPKEIKVRISGSMFQKNDQHSRPEMSSFYSSNNGFQSLHDEEFEGMMSGQKDEQRSSQLSSYSQQYSSRNAYKHELKIETEARTAQTTHKMMVNLMGTCDSQLKHCKLSVDAERSPIGNENQKWILKSQLQTVAPESVRANENPTEKQSRLLVQIDSEWGSDEKNKMNVRLQAEPTKLSIQSDRWARFLNKIDMVADYQIRTSKTQTLLQHLFEVLKSKVFWQLNSEQRRGEEGIIRALAIIDPMTRRYANVTIQTSQERLQIQNLQVSPQVFSLVAFPLEKQQPMELKSFGGLMKRMSNFGNAECRADESRVRGFDKVAYQSPLSSCWSVLAKDCSRDEPRFVVMMRKNGDEKKVRVITRDGKIELTGQSENEKVKVHVNGEHIRDEERLSDEGIKFQNNKVYVSKREIAVEFNGQEVKVKIAPEYKNIQCGLCGHYNDEDEDVFRTNDNQLSNSIKEFHRSFTFKNEECEEDELNKFYEQKGREFETKPRKQQKPSRAYNLWTNEDLYDTNDDEDQWQSSSEQLKEKSKFKRKITVGKKRLDIKPISRTESMEYNHKICFSTKPVKGCPRGTTPDDEAETQSTSVEFFCLERTSTDARRLLRQVRQDSLIDTAGRPVAFNQNIDQPTKCLAF
ncbi:hypothetical protein M3Y96_00186500 [Aphelenchoides besseyi]|nr:hypothetical protein M3Y96_00186500 [Aphelenchoides besseyi]